MPVPFLAPLLGSMIGTAAAPALAAGAGAGAAAGGGSLLAGLFGGGAAAGAGGGVLSGLLGAAAPSAIGAGLGTLAAGGSGEEALKNAVGFGVGAMAMPGLTNAVQSAGKPMAEGIAGALNPGGTAAAPTTSLRPQARPPGLGNMAAGGPQEAAKAAMDPMELADALGGVQQEEPETKTTVSAPAAAGALPMNLASARPGADVPSMGEASAAPAAPTASSAAPVTVPSVDMDPRRRMTAADGGLMDVAAFRNMNLPVDRLPNFSDRQQAYQMAQMERARFAAGGYIQGPGTKTSDDIDAVIYQNGVPVQEALLSDGEVVLSHKDLAAMDPDGDSNRAGQLIGGAPNGQRAKKAAEMYMALQKEMI